MSIPSWLTAPQSQSAAVGSPPRGNTRIPVRSDVLVPVVLVVVEDLDDKGHGAGDVQAPHLHLRRPLQARTTHKVQKLLLGPVFRRNPCRALAPKKVTPPQLSNFYTDLAHRLLRLLGSILGHTFEAVDLNGWL